MLPGPVDRKSVRPLVAHHLCFIELHRHRLVLGMLELLVEEVSLTPAQAREVFAEIAARERLIKEVQRQANAERTNSRQHKRREDAAGLLVIGA